LAAPLGYIAAGSSRRAQVLESHNINYWCEGDRLLGDVLAEKGLDPEMVIRELSAAGADDGETSEENWSNTTMQALIDHLQNAHHLYLKRELPELSMIVARVSILHGDVSSELRELDDAFEWFRSDMEMLMRKEELVLFPMCLRLEGARERPDFFSETIETPIRHTAEQHKAAAYALARMCSLTHQFSPAADSCDTYMEMVSRLSQLNRDTHLHVHEENNILFPRAIAMEKELPPKASNMPVSER